MTRNEQQLYSDVTSIKESLQKIANALETNVPTTPKPKDIPGFEGTLDALDVLCDIKTITDEYATLNQSNEALIARHKTKLSSEFYETDLQGIKVDSDHDIRSTAMYYEETVLANGGTKKECILDYITNEFGIVGARYTDIIKFAYYLGAPNSPKYSNSNRGYYSCALNAKLNGHLIQGGKDCLVKGINKEGNERYFALSSVDNFTDYYKRIA